MGKTISWLLFGVLTLLSGESVLGQFEFDDDPINYESTAPTDRVAKLIAEMEAGRTTLDWDDRHGWLPDLLNELEIKSSSQTLVFSKTSLQLRKIRPSSARAVYFNEDVYLGFVRKGDFLEIAAVDPVQGAIFYTLDQERTDNPKFKRANYQCLSCHGTNNTQEVPGFLTRSVFPKKSGHPEFRLGTTRTDHTTDFHDRFGGWYVTGQHGDMRHRGNVLVNPDAEDDEALNRDIGANLDELPVVANEEFYLEPTSDIVALMIMEHQTQFHNFVTRASYVTRQALHYQKEMNKILEREEGFQSDSTKRRIQSAAERLVEYTFFCKEFQLTSPVRGSKRFVEEFSENAVRDEQGRSLKDLDLETRLLKYPCSYLVYTDAFCSLPAEILTIVKNRMLEILEGRDESKKFQHLSEQERQAILEILQETHPVFQSN